MAKLEGLYKQYRLGIARGKQTVITKANKMEQQ